MMENAKNIVDSELEDVNGGSGVSDKGVCQRCGEKGKLFTVSVGGTVKRVCSDCKLTLGV